MLERTKSWVCAKSHIFQNLGGVDLLRANDILQRESRIAAVGISECLKVNDSLIKLYLGFNNFGDNVSLIFDAIKSNPKCSLEYLDLEYVQISKSMN